MTRALTVWWEGAVVGSLTADRHGAMRFVYDGNWVADPAAPALSVSLPKRREPFPPRQCRPFFEGLLPEGAQRDAVASALGNWPVSHWHGLRRSLPNWPSPASTRPLWRLAPSASPSAPGASLRWSDRPRPGGLRPNQRRLLARVGWGEQPEPQTTIDRTTAARPPRRGRRSGCSAGRSCPRGRRTRTPACRSAASGPPR